MEYLFIYALQMADVTETMSTLATFILVLVVATNIILDMAAEFEFEWVKTVFKATKKYITNTIIVLIVLLLIPTQQTLLLMGGTYLGKRAVNAVATSDKLEKVNTIIDLQLDKYIKEMKAGK